MIKASNGSKVKNFGCRVWRTASLMGWDHLVGDRAGHWIVQWKPASTTTSEKSKIQKSCFSKHPILYKMMPYYVVSFGSQNSFNSHQKNQNFIPSSNASFSPFPCRSRVSNFIPFPFSPLLFNSTLSTSTAATGDQLRKSKWPWLEIHLIH